MAHADLLAIWSTLCGTLIDPKTDLTAVTWSMLDILRGHSQPLRALELPPPPRP